MGERPMRRMPTFFGPSLGPRQGPGGRRFANEDTPLADVYTATFASQIDQSDLILPHGLELAQPHTVTIMFAYYREIEWLAGRGYAVFGVYTPAVFTGGAQPVFGDLNLVLWENMADPIITGREELGVAKVFCELPDPYVEAETVRCMASWDGFRFAEMEFQSSDTGFEPALPPQTRSTGILHHKYSPATGDWGGSDCDAITFTPAETPNCRTIATKHFRSANIAWQPGQWSDLPTLHHIVSGLADIELGECLQATYTQTRGNKELRDQRVLRSGEAR